MLRTGCPAAVARLVVAVVVDPVEAAAVGALAHVGEEVGKRMPAFADADPASAVVVPADVARVLAAVEHIPP